MIADYHNINGWWIPIVGLQKNQFDIYINDFLDTIWIKQTL